MTKDFNEPNRIGESRIPTLPALNLIKEVDSELLSDHDLNITFRNSRAACIGSKLANWQSYGRRCARIIIAWSGRPLQSPSRRVIGGLQGHSIFRPLLRGR